MTPPATKKEVFSWCLYDFANSAFTTIIVTVGYSVYFTQVVARDHQPESWWGWGYGISMLVIGLLSPVLGALADFTGTRKAHLIGFTLLSVFATFLLVLVKEGDIWLGIILFALANIGFNGGITFYNAFLNDISTDRNMGRISGSCLVAFSRINKTNGMEKTKKKHRRDRKAHSVKKKIV